MAKPNKTIESYVTYKDVEEAVKCIRSKTPLMPKIGIICGSGLGDLADLIQDSVSIEYKSIPGFPIPTVEGHAGALVLGTLAKVPVVCMKGRIHAYEGYSLARCTLPIRVMKMLGCSVLIVTNAAGGLNPDLNVSDIMIIHDHLFFAGFAGNNPVRGPNDERFGPRFPPMNNAYDRKLIEKADKCVADLGFNAFVRKGVYTMIGGPNYETIAEARFLRQAGADTIGMSTAHEVVVANHAGLQVLGFSLVTNKIFLDYNEHPEPNHEEVLAAAKKRSADFEQLITAVVEEIGKQFN